MVTFGFTSSTTFVQSDKNILHLKSPHAALLSNCAQCEAEADWRMLGNGGGGTVGDNVRLLHTGAKYTAITNISIPITY